VTRPSNGPPGSRAARRAAPSKQTSGSKEEAPLQVMVPVALKRQLAMMSAERGESLRTLMLRGLRSIGLDVPEAELADRRKRRRPEGTSHGAK